MQSGTNEDLNAVWGSAGGVNAFVIGDGGTILHLDDSLWSAIASGTDKNLYGIWGSVGNYDLFVVGADGTILYYDARADKDESDDFGDSCEYATEVNVNSVVEGNIDFENDHDFFLIDIPSSGMLTISTTGNTDTHLFMSYDSNCNRSGQTGSGGQGDNFLYNRFFYEVTTYYISVSSSRSIGDYTLHVDFQPDTDVSFFYRAPSYGYAGDSLPVTIYGKNTNFDNGTTVSFECSGITVNSTTVNSPIKLVSRITIDNEAFSQSCDVVVNTHAGQQFVETNAFRILAEPTLITLSSFTVTPKNKKVIIKWSTESETDNAGFNIYRSTSEEGDYEQINDLLISAEGSITEGAEYEFIDDDVKNRKKYYYKLEDIDMAGMSTMQEPVSATPRLIYIFFR
jgi:hypothetical protein